MPFATNSRQRWAFFLWPFQSVRIYCSNTMWDKQERDWSTDIEKTTSLGYSTSLPPPTTVKYFPDVTELQKFWKWQKKKRGQLKKFNLCELNVGQSGSRNEWLSTQKASKGQNSNYRLWRLGLWPPVCPPPWLSFLAKWKIPLELCPRAQQWPHSLVPYRFPQHKLSKNCLIKSS